MEDLEEDPEYRKNINIYKGCYIYICTMSYSVVHIVLTYLFVFVADDSKGSMPVESEDEGDVPRISLQEMLEDLQLDDEEMEDLN